MRSVQATRKQISAEAVEWFLHFQNTPRAEQNGPEFSEWLLRSPVHVEEYLRVSCAWRVLDVKNEGDLHTEALITAAQEQHATDNVIRFEDHLIQPPPLADGNRGYRSFKKAWVKALAAAVVLGVGLCIAYLKWDSAMTFRTAVGEQRSFALQDGSVVFLNTDSAVRVRWLSAERHIDLIRGEALFGVAKDPAHPFTVSTTKAAVRALGTIFNVRADPESTQVAVLEGQVEVVAAARAADTGIQTSAAAGQVPAVSPHALSSIRLMTGERAAVTSQGIETNSGPTMESVMAWTKRHLVFRDQPLSTVVGEFNRYRTRPLVLDDPALAALKISGVFDLADPESLLAYLSLYEGVQVDRNADGSEHLSRRPGVAPARK